MSSAGRSRRDGVLEQRAAEISKLQQGRKYHDRRYRLRQCGTLHIGKCRKAARAENNDREQNEKSESNSEYRSNQRAANRQRNHTAILRARVSGNRNGRRLTMA